MRATRKIHTDINQIDCAVRNDFTLPLTVYSEFNSFIYGECKNELKTAGNSYYYKIHGIINRSKSKEERGFGILFSRENVASTCITLARDFFMMDNIIIINMYNKDFKDIESGVNFLTIVQEKIQTIKNSIVTESEKHSLYR